eukprot:scaffold10220_cov49-Phaeocystis_antarctica.AAC.3
MPSDIAISMAPPRYLILHDFRQLLLMARVAEAWVLARRPQGVARWGVISSADSWAGTAADAGPAAAQGVARRVVTASADSSAGKAADAGPAAEMQLRRVALEASSVAQARVAEAW